MSKKVVLEQQFNTFTDFWEQVNPFGKTGQKMSGFIFRGEPSDEYSLLPTALREENPLEQCEITKIHNEILSLCRFYKEANNHGLKIPNNKILQGDSPAKFIGNGLFWYSDEFEETAALAQHYGINTRLLDWTKDIFVAFYFASTGVLKDSIVTDEEGNFVIYALNYQYLTHKINDWRIHEQTINRKPLPIKFVVPHYAEIPNIYAQNGILSYSEVFVHPVHSRSSNIDFTPLDEKLKIIANEAEYDLSNSDILLYKFILPKFEATKMLIFVSRLNYTYSRLFPGYAGIKQTLLEKQLVKSVVLRILNGT